MYKGTWRGAKVAVKKLRFMQMSDKELSEFRREASTMRWGTASYTFLFVEEELT